MTNFEKYKDELCKILSYFVRVSDDKPRICNDLSCKNCDFDDYGLDCIQEVEDWLKKEVTKRPLVDVPDMNVGKCSEIPNNSDCISRQAAIEKLKREFNETDVPDRYPGIFDAIEEWLSERELPSVQSEIIRCKDCAWGMTGEFSKNFFCSRTGALTWAEPDSFCNYAERKKDG